MRISTDIFLLTSEWQDANGRTVLRFYGVSPEHRAIAVVIDNQRPVFFIPRSAKLPRRIKFAERRSVKLKNFGQQDVDALYFATQSGLREAAATLREAGVPTFEADIRPDRRFLMERFINAQMRVEGVAVGKGRVITLRNPRVAPGEIMPVFSVASLDIETGDENRKLYSIAVHLSGSGGERKRVFMVGKTSGEQGKHLYLYPTEKEVLEDFFAWFVEVDPDIIIGWNVVGFDLRIIAEKCREYRLRFDFSRSSRQAVLRKPERGGLTAEISGRVVIEGGQALRGAFYSFEDYRLETVSQALLGTGKLIASGQDKVAEIEHLFREDKAALARYNLEDCVLVTKIFEKTGLLEMMVKRAQLTGLLLNQIGRSVAAFDHYYLPKFHRKGFVAPDVDDIVLQGHAAGGYVMEPEPGIYQHVAVLDFKSLYPSIIQSFKIDPLSRLQANINPIETPQGFRFSDTEHILPEFINRLMAQRSEARHKGDAHLSQAIKILMNSFYGVMGTPGCRFYHPDLPSAITGTGQWLLKGCKAFLEKQGYRVLYGDTDSVFVQLKPEEAAEAEACGRKLAEELNDHWQKRLKKMGITSHLEMEFEKYYRKFVLPLARAIQGGARKRYAGLLLKDDAPVLEFVGMEYVRSDWTPLAKSFQYELYLRLLTGQEYQGWIRALVKQVLAGDLDEQLIYRKRLRKPVDEYTKNISPQVRAARMLETAGREVRYLVTRQGPVPIQLRPTDIDYQHYIEKQLKPIADSILGLTGTSFDELIQPEQLRLF